MPPLCRHLPPPAGIVIALLLLAHGQRLVAGLNPVVVGLEIQKPGSATWYALADTKTFLLGSSYTIRTVIDDGPGDPTWSTTPAFTGAPSGTGEEQEVTFGTVGTFTITAMIEATDSEVSFTARVIRPDIHSLDFTTNTQAVDGVSGAEWTLTDEQPICYVRDSDVVLTVRLTGSSDINYTTEIQIDGDDGTADPVAYDATNVMVKSNTSGGWTATPTVDVEGSGSQELVDSVQRYATGDYDTATHEGTFLTTWRYRVCNGHSYSSWYDMENPDKKHRVYLPLATAAAGTSLDEEVLDHSCRWAADTDEEGPFRTALMDDGFAAEYDWNFQCNRLASDFVRACTNHGVGASLHKWSSNDSEDPPYTAADNMCYQRTIAFDPVGSTHGNGQQDWAWHQWAESDGSQYDPSGYATLAGDWGDYEDHLFGRYKRSIGIMTFAWENNQPDQTAGCEPNGQKNTPTPDTWTGPNAP